MSDDEGSISEIEEFEQDEFIEEIEEDDKDDDEDDMDDGDDILDMSTKCDVDIISKEDTYNKLNTYNRKTKPFMSKFEFTKLIGARSQQLSSGMPPTIEKLDNVSHTKFIAVQELKEGKLPLIIRRIMPDGSIEDWRANELAIPMNIYQ
jgi:DNA-directed RNA polymerase I, II, and III subunit RPABC2